MALVASPKQKRDYFDERVQKQKDAYKKREASKKEEAQLREAERKDRQAKEEKRRLARRKSEERLQTRKMASLEASLAARRKTQQRPATRRGAESYMQDFLEKRGYTREQLKQARESREQGKRVMARSAHADTRNTHNLHGTRNTRDTHTAHSNRAVKERKDMSWDFSEFLTTVKHRPAGLAPKTYGTERQSLILDTLTTKPIGTKGMTVISSWPHEGKAMIAAREIERAAIKQLGINGKSRVFRASIINPPEAGNPWIESAKRRKAAIIIVDGLMPNSSNLKKEKVRDLIKSFPKVPVVILTCAKDPVAFAHACFGIKPDNVVMLSRAKDTSEF